MSALEELTFKWQREYSRRFTKHLGQYYKAVDKLQAECQHEKTHWIQELVKDGTFEEALVKRCFVCGKNIDKLEADSVFIETVLNEFDASVERRKALTNADKPMKERES